MKDRISIIETIAKEAVEPVKNSRKIILFENRGSATDAQHIAGELAGKIKLKRESSPAIAFTANTSSLKVSSNDSGFGDVFSRQVERLVIGISTNGESWNVVKSVPAAKNKGAKTIALNGGDGGKLAKIAISPLLSLQRALPEFKGLT